MTDQTAATEAARILTAALDRMSDQLTAVRQDSEARDEALATYGRKNRRLILWTIASVVLDIALTVTLSVVAIQAHNASVAARHASASNYALCRAGNTARAQQVQLWAFLLSLSKKPQTLRQRHNIAAFETQLHHIFAARDCAALARKAS